MTEHATSSTSLQKTIIYCVGVTKLDQDNRTYGDYYDPGVFYVRKEEAQIEVDRLNARERETWDKEQSREKENFLRNRAEWIALHEAGLRGEWNGRDWQPRTFKGAYYVDEADLNGYTRAIQKAANA